MSLPKNKAFGKVYLTGAGPGDPGLLTVRAFELLFKADAVVYDHLVSENLLNLFDAEKIYAGKDGKSGEAVDQKWIHQTLVKLAKQGKTVVRLKGGDPFIFGRGGEEATYLKKAGIEFEVVPGVSAGYAVPAYAGIPVTDRRHASQVTFVTAHEKPGKAQPQVDWKALAALDGTLVIFMGMKNLKSITEKLTKFGKSPKTPAAVIEQGTTPLQRTVTATLGTIARRAAEERMSSPALTVIGEVVSLRKDTAWFEKKPLLGKTVLVTRASSQAAPLKKLLEEKGARVLEMPGIEILPPENWSLVDAALDRFGIYDWVVFTSTNGVDYFFSRLRELGKDSRIFSGKRIAVIGERTAEALEENGLKADLIPEVFTSEGLADAFRKEKIQGLNILLARTDIAPDYLVKALRGMGAQAEDLTVYRTKTGGRASSKKALENWFSKRKIDYITFTSASTVRGFFEALPPKAKRTLKSRLISIGPVTSGALKAYGVKPYREAKIHTIPELVETLCR